MGLNDELSCFIDFSAALSRSAQKVELVIRLNAANFREKESICVRSNCFDQNRQELVSDYLNRVRKVGRNKQKKFSFGPDFLISLHAQKDLNRRRIQPAVWVVCY